MVKDDFGINIIYDCSFLDVESLENEIVKTKPILDFFVIKFMKIKILPGGVTKHFIFKARFNYLLNIVK